MSFDGSMKAVVSADITNYLNGMDKVATTAAGVSGKVNGSLGGMGNGAKAATEKTGFLNTSIGKIAAGVGAVSLVSKGIGVLKDSIGGAIGRFDTLNQYPKVMAQMGFSTDDTTKSVGILKKGVDGLPTSLQDLTKSAQSFAILEKSATGGAKTATALNDAFLASHASAADASRGVEQYSQMLATGKVDLMSWRTLQETMPYGLTKVAKSFGITGKSAERDLYAKLKSGDITMDQLNKHFIQLDGGAKGFAATARIAGEGIGNSFINMKNAVKNGLANTITAIDNGLKNAGINKGISGVFDKAKTSIISSFAAINKAVSTAIPPIIAVIKGLIDFVNKNQDWILPLTKNLGIAFGTIFGGIAVINSFKKAINGIGTAFGAIVNHPIISVLVILITSFLYAYQNSEKFRSGVNNVVKAISDFAGRAGGFIKSLNDSSKSSGKLKTAFEVLAGTSGALGLFLAIKKIVGTLKPLSSLFNSTKGSASGLGGAIKSSGGNAKKSSSLFSGFGGSVLKAGAGIGIAAAGIALIAKAMQGISETGSSGVAPIIAFGAAISIMAATLALTGKSLTTNAAGIAVFAGAVSIMSLAIAPIAKTGTEGAIAIGAFGLSVSGMAAVLALVGPLLTANAVGIAVFGGSILAIGTGVGIATLGIATMINSVANLTLAFIALVAVRGQIVETLTAIGVGLADMINGFINNIVANMPVVVNTFINGLLSILQNIQQKISKFVDAGTGIVISFLQGIANKVPNIIGAAVNIIVAFINGIAANLGRVINAAMNLVDSMVSGILQAQNRLINAAVTLINGFANNIRSHTGEMRGAALNLLDAIVRVFVPNSLVNAGESIISGFLSGLKNGFEKVKNFVGGIATWIKEHKGPISYDKKLLIPAGNAIMNGFGNALDNSFSNVKSSVSSYAGQLSGAMNNVSFNGAISKVQGFANQLQNPNVGLVANTSLHSGTTSVSENMDQDILNAPSSVVNLTVEQNWDGDKVYYSIKNKDARERVRINVIKK